MSGEHRRPGGWVLPVIVIGVAACLLLQSSGQGALSPAALKPLQWVGVAVTLAGAVAAFAVRKRPFVRLAGVLVCGVGAIMAICL